MTKYDNNVRKLFIGLGVLVAMVLFVNIISNTPTEAELDWATSQSTIEKYNSFDNDMVSDW